jgi:uncharacterized protein YrzB (UPF0473 family)
LLTENRGGSSSRGRETLHNNDGFDDARIGTQRGKSTADKSLVDQQSDFEKNSVIFHPDRDDAHSNTRGSKQASTIHPDQNEDSGFGNVESDPEEEEEDWNDDAETARGQPTRFSEAMAIEVRSTRIEDL